MRLGTRGSRLALVQARVVADLIRSKCPGIGVELVILKTSGDVRSEFGDEISNTVGEFSSELEKALISNDIDAAVHSAKDLPTKMPDSLMVGAFPERADPRDAWVSQVEPMSKKRRGDGLEPKVLAEGYFGLREIPSLNLRISGVMWIAEWSAVQATKIGKGLFWPVQELIALVVFLSVLRWFALKQAG